MLEMSIGCNPGRRYHRSDEGTEVQRLTIKVLNNAARPVMLGLGGVLLLDIVNIIIAMQKVSMRRDV